MTAPTDHDQLFKETIREFFPAFLRLAVPQFADKFDFAALRWLDKELFPAPPDGPEHVLDLVAELRPTEPVVAGTDPTDCLALVHVEVESREATTDIESRLPRYFRHLRDKYGKPVLPVVVYLKVALGGIGVRQVVDSYFGFAVETFQYFYVALPGLSAEEYLAGENWLGVAWSALMRAPKGRRLDLGVEAMRRLGDAPLTDFQRDRLGDCVEAYIDLPEEEIRRFRGILEANATGRVPPMNKTRAQIAEEQGMERGLARGTQIGLEKGTEIGIEKGKEIGKEIGMAEGQLRALRAAVAESFEARFGAVPADLSTHLAGVHEEAELRRLLRAVVTAADAATAQTAFGARP